MTKKLLNDFVPYSKGRPAPASAKRPVATTFCVSDVQKEYLLSLGDSDISVGLDAVLGALAGRPLPAVVIPGGVPAAQTLKAAQDRAEALRNDLRRLVHDFNAPQRSAADQENPAERQNELARVRQELDAIATALVQLKSDLLGGYAPPFPQLGDIAGKWVVEFNDLIRTRNADPKDEPCAADLVIPSVADDAVIARLLAEARLAKSGPIVPEHVRRPAILTDMPATLPEGEPSQFAVRLFRSQWQQINSFRREHHFDGCSEAVRAMIGAVKQSGGTPFVLKTRVASVGTLDQLMSLLNGVYSALEAIESRLALGVAAPANAAAVQDFKEWERMVWRHKARIKLAASEVRRVRHVLIVALQLDTQFLADRICEWVGRALDRRTKWKARGSVNPGDRDAQEYLALGNLVARDDVLWRLFHAVGLTAVSSDRRVG